jgi:hypothetical protein
MAEAARLRRMIGSPLMNLITQDKNAVLGVRNLREKASKMRMQKLKPPQTLEAVMSLRLRECTYFDNVVPPLDYGWMGLSEQGECSPISQCAIYLLVATLRSG